MLGFAASDQTIETKMFKKRPLVLIRKGYG
jgi:hypothetical protein